LGGFVEAFLEISAAEQRNVLLEQIAVVADPVVLENCGDLAAKLPVTQELVVEVMPNHSRITAQERAGKLFVGLARRFEVTLQIAKESAQRMDGFVAPGSGPLAFRHSLLGIGGRDPAQ